VSYDIAQLRERLERAVAMDAPVRPDVLDIRTLATLYLAHATKAYNGRYGAKELATIRQAMEPLVTLYGDLDPGGIRPLHLLAARQLWIERGMARTTIQARIQRIRHCWRWARRVELIDTDLPDIEPVRFGHARDPDPIAPVDMDVFRATIARLSPIAVVLLNVIRLTGMRPGEACDMRGCDIDLSRDPWRYRPLLHKTKWRGRSRDVLIGPQCQRLLLPLLAPSWLFTTRSGRKWTTSLLHSAVRNCCIRHDIPHWHPNQLRHTAATVIRREMSLEHAQAMLGHSSIETTQVYAERDERLAAEVALKFG
jgi:integrase